MSYISEQIGGMKYRCLILAVIVLLSEEFHLQVWLLVEQKPGGKDVVLMRSLIISSVTDIYFDERNSFE